LKKKLFDNLTSSLTSTKKLYMREPETAGSHKKVRTTQHW